MNPGALNRRPLLNRLLLVAVALCWAAAARAAERFDRARFEKEIRPLLAERCVECHGDLKQKGSLRLDAKIHVFAGGENGPVIAAGDAAKSSLFQRITSKDSEQRMPPKGAPLTVAQIASIKTWIDAGAVWPENEGDKAAAAGRKLPHWSLKALQPPTVPVQKGTRWPRNDVDRFILGTLSERGLKPAAEADRRTLIRRLYFDLVGLPPEARRIQRFVDDPDPHAYERLVDELLASPHHGERWARHWLDVVHYGDTHGYDKDKPRPNAWPYRDYVIRAFNEDKPYARFVQEQIAGDVLFPGTTDGVVALGFLSAGPWDLIGHEEVPESKIDGKIARHLDRDDMVQNAMGTFNSLTVGCAQCHKHKFDSISQLDYYSLQSVFAAVDRADKAYFPDAAQTARYPEAKFRQRTLTDRKASLDSKIKTAAGAELVDVDKRIAAAGSEAAVLDALRAEREALLAKAGDEKTRLELAQTLQDLKAINEELKSFPKPQTVYAATVHFGSGNFPGTGPSGGKPRPVHLLARGDVRQPKEEVQPAALSCIEGLPSGFALPPGAPDGERRAALAKWLSSPGNPLTWRSIVNRVWQHHFGRGLVETPNDFGRMGALPTHPELLEWLACEFRDGGGSFKRLHKLIVMSATYRQSTKSGARADAIDSENRLLSHQNRRKLDAEAIRDSVLLVAGKLDLGLGGPAFQDFVVEKPEHSPHYVYRLHDPDDPKAHRRSIYRFIVRSQLNPFMTTLDCADPSMQVGRRNESVSALQALALLNNGLMVTMSSHFAANLDAAGGTTDQKIDRAFLAALGRSPTRSERKALAAYAGEHGMANACRVVFNLNEFAFVD